MRNQNWMSLWSEGALSPITELRREMDRLFDDFWAAPATQRQLQTAGQLTPACDVEEDKDRFLLTLEMPGVKKEDLRIEVLDNQLVVRGERRDERKGRDGAARYSERRFGKFERSFALPAGIDASRIEASYEDGMLQLRVPKAEAAKPRTIRIQDRAVQGSRAQLGQADQVERDVEPNQASERVA
jgi:HSP20 family protein